MAIDLGARLGASVTLMHAFQVPVYTFPSGALVATAEVMGSVTTAAQDALNDAAARYANRGVVITTLLRDGVPWEEVNAVATETKADLIVIGTHGRRGIARALLGSVAEQVVRTSLCPVLTVRGDDEATPAEVAPGTPVARAPEPAISPQ